MSNPINPIRPGSPSRPNTPPKGPDKQDEKQYFPTQADEEENPYLEFVPQDNSTPTSNFQRSPSTESSTSSPHSINSTIREGQRTPPRQNSSLNGGLNTQLVSLNSSLGAVSLNGSQLNSSTALTSTLHSGLSTTSMLNNALINSNEQPMSSALQDSGKLISLGIAKIQHTKYTGALARTNLRDNISLFTSDMVKRAQEANSVDDAVRAFQAGLNAYTAESEIGLNMTTNNAREAITHSESMLKEVDNSVLSLARITEGFISTEQAIVKQYNERIATYESQAHKALALLKQKKLTAAEIKEKENQIKEKHIENLNKIEHEREHKRIENFKNERDAALKALKQEQDIKIGPFLKEYERAMDDYKRQWQQLDQVMKNSKAYNIKYTPPVVERKPDGTPIGVKLGTVSWTSTPK